jgi:transcriptional regulator with XRE-family HTH domain
MRKARRLAGLSMEELGEIVGVSRTTISSWENDETTPSKAAVVFTALRCSVPVWWLLDEPEGSDGWSDEAYYVNAMAGRSAGSSTIW